jgi:toxin ParE1/3/4
VAVSKPNYRLSRQAQDDLLGIARYIARERPRAATRVVEAIRESFRFIAYNPECGSDCTHVRPYLRMFVAKPPANRYAIFFRPIESEGVTEFVAVIDAARDWEELLRAKA